MTLIDLANDIGVTRAAIYQRLKREGVDVATLRDSDGNITSEGAQLIRAMFDGVHHKKQAVDSGQNTETSSVINTSSVEVLRIQLEAMTRERDLLQEQLNLLREQLEHERANTEHARADADRAHAEADQWRQQAQRLLPSATEARLSLWQRFKAWATGSSANREERQD